MPNHAVATRADWEAARVELLATEKRLMRMGDDLARQRRALAWVRVEGRDEDELAWTMSWLRRHDQYD